MTPQNPPTPHSKPCTLCQKPRDVLVRCQIDSTARWHLICPGTCWKKVSGGIIDGDGADEHQYYRYGGMWKNKHDAVSAKKPKRGKAKARKAGSAPREGKSDGDGTDTAAEGEAERESGGDVPEWRGNERKYTKNDRVMFDEKVWICRKSHVSVEGRTPPGDVAHWKEAVALRVEPD